MRALVIGSLKCASILLLLVAVLSGQSTNFRDAPASAKSLKNPYQGQNAAPGRQAFQTNCSQCHGQSGEGTGNVPSLNVPRVKAATAGELFWFITNGDINNGMPSWSKLPEQERWQIVSYIQALGTISGTPQSSATSDAPEPTSVLNLPAPKAPFTDFRFEKPGTVRKITLDDLPAPFATPSAPNGPKLVPRPEGAWPQVPDGFKVGLFASGFEEPRLIRNAPNGDLFIAEKGGTIKVIRGTTAKGEAELIAVFADGLKMPFGINFYPPGSNPQWVYIGSLHEVVRYPYQNGDLKARGPGEHIADLPGGEYHWTRDIQFSLDGKRMFVAVGAASNVDDPDTAPAEKNTARILQFNPDGSEMRVYASGIRNPVGLAINPTTGELWCSTNERDGLGDNLVPDYITHVQDGGFYGWPWWYMGGHQDPRHRGKHPELKDKVITPDVILNPHNASLEISFYNGTQFPAEYQGDIFASEHGSWNRSVRVGYELIRVPLHQSAHATGEYQDFMTGFVVDNAHVWGRPVGVAVAPDGSLLVTDDGSNSIWRITYEGK
jgi:glucose/arabinose dehydrogenase/cytochrome c5